MLAGFFYKKFCSSNFHSAYLLLLQQIYRISSHIVCNELATRAECACMELPCSGKRGRNRSARKCARLISAAVDESGPLDWCRLSVGRRQAWCAYCFTALLSARLIYSFACQNDWLDPLLPTEWMIDTGRLEKCQERCLCLARCNGLLRRNSLPQRSEQGWGWIDRRESL